MIIRINGTILSLDSYVEMEKELDLYIRIPENLTLEEVGELFRANTDDIEIWDDTEESLEATYTGYLHVRGVEKIYGDPQDFYVIKLEQTDIKRTIQDSAKAITDIQMGMAELYEMILGG